jgi:hypothetical protein
MSEWQKVAEMTHAEHIHHLVQLRDLDGRLDNSLM